MKLLKLKRGIFSQYRKNVKGNADTPYHIVQAKLTRNVDLAYQEVPRTAHDRQQGILHYHYGNLHITVKGDTIVDLKNSRRYSDWFYKDEQRYQELNNLLGITDYENRLKPWWHRLLGKLGFKPATN
jgi:hypothetical protein